MRGGHRKSAAVTIWERWLFYGFLFLAPIEYVDVQVAVATVTLGQALRVLLLCAFGVRLLYPRLRLRWPRVGFELFVAYIFVSTVIGAMVASVFADRHGLVLAAITRPLIRAPIQLLEIFAWAATFYYGYWIVRMYPRKTFTALALGLGLQMGAAVVQLAWSQLGKGALWSISTLRGEHAFIEIAGQDILRVNGLAGEPKGLGSLMTLVMGPSLAGAVVLGRRRNRRISLIAFIISVFLVVVSFSASAVAAAIVSIILTSGILLSIYETGRRELRRIVGVMCLGGVLFGAGISVVPSVQRGAVTQVKRLGAFVGVETDARAYGQPVEVRLPFASESGSIKMSAMEGAPLAFMLAHPWTAVTGVGDGMVSVLARPHLGGRRAYLPDQYAGVISPSIGMIQYVCDWGLIGIILFGWFGYRSCRYSWVQAREGVHDETRWRAVLVIVAAAAVGVSFVNIGHGLTGVWVFGAAAGIGNQVGM